MVEHRTIYIASGNCFLLIGLTPPIFFFFLVSLPTLLGGVTKLATFNNTVKDNRKMEGNKYILITKK